MSNALRNLKILDPSVAMTVCLMSKRNTSVQIRARYLPKILRSHNKHTNLMEKATPATRKSSGKSLRAKLQFLCKTHSSNKGSPSTWLHNADRS